MPGPRRARSGPAISPPGPAGGRIALVAASVVILASTVVWPRVQVLSVVIPLQRLISYIAFAVTIVALRRTVRRPGWLLGALLGVFALFLLWVAVDSGIHMGAAGFQVLPAVMDLSKYVAAFMTAVTLALAVRSRVLTGAAARRLLMWSSLFFIAVAYGCLVAYWAGFRVEDGLVIKSFGDAWGVWPTSTAVPRLVGLSTEPQQFSVVYVTGLLAMMQERRARWQIAAAFGLIALLLSQSKYSLLSVVVAAVWWFCNVGVARGFSRRKWVASGVAAIIILVGALGAASLLPTFQATLQTGLNGGAFTERSGNAALLTEAFAGSPGVGIGPAQYGVFRAHELGIPVDNAYYPNNDFLKVAAELGVPGLILLVVILVLVALALQRGLCGPSRVVVLPLAIGSALILGNMLIGYELLHVFFWVNVGLLVGVGGVVGRRRERPIQQ